MPYLLSMFWIAILAFHVAPLQSLGFGSKFLAIHLCCPLVQPKTSEGHTKSDPRVNGDLLLWFLEWFRI